MKTHISQQQFFHRKTLLLSGIVLICALSFWEKCETLYAQQPTIEFERFSVEHGLSHSNARTIIQDRNGFLWIGTEEGLNRFDGYSFKTFVHDDHDSTSLPNDFISSIREDAEGRLWLATHGGLVLFDPHTGRCLKTWQHSNTDTTTLNDNFLTCLHVDNEENIWFGSMNGLGKLNPATGFCKRFFYHEKPGNAGKHIIWRMHSDAHGTLWLGTQNHGVIALNTSTGSSRGFKQQDKDTTSLSGKTVWGIAEDAQGRICVGAWAGGLNRLNAQTGVWEHLRTPASHPEALPRNIILKLLKDRSGRLWAGTRAGVGLLDTATQTFTYYQHDPIITTNVIKLSVNHYF